ncbi:MAG: ArsR/SmtB family transcription factor [Nocardioides sp.]
MSTAWESLSDPVRRQIVHRLSRGALTAGEIAADFAISRPAVSRHLRVLRESGVVQVRPEAQRRVYSLAPDGLDEVQQWVEEVGAFWTQRLDALGTELVRGRRTRRPPIDEEKP